MFVEDMLIGATTLARFAIMVIYRPVTALWFRSFSVCRKLVWQVHGWFIVIVKGRFIDIGIGSSDDDTQHMVLVVQLRDWRKVRIERLMVDKWWACHGIWIRMSVVVRIHIWRLLWSWRRHRLWWRLHRSNRGWRWSDSVDRSLVLVLSAFGKFRVFAFAGRMQ